MSSPAGATGQDPKKESGKESRSRARLWRDIWGLLMEFWAAHRITSASSLALLLVSGATSGLYMLTLRGLIDALTGSPAAGATGGDAAIFWVWMFIATAAVEVSTNNLHPILTTYLRDQGVHRIQRRVLVRAAAAPLIQFEEGAFFDHLQRATAGMGERLVELYGRLVNVVRALFGLGSLALSLFIIHPALLPLLAVGTLPSLWLQGRVATAVYQAQREHTMRDRLRGHLHGLLTGRDAAAEVRLFGTAGYLLNRWSQLRSHRQRDVLAAERRRAVFTTSGDLIAGVAYAAGLVLVAALVLRGQLSLGAYVAVGQAALWFQSGLADLIGSLRWLEEAQWYR